MNYRLFALTVLMSSTLVGLNSAHATKACYPLEKGVISFAFSQIHNLDGTVALSNLQIDQHSSRTFRYSKVSFPEMEGVTSDSFRKLSSNGAVFISVNPANTQVKGLLQLSPTIHNAIKSMSREEACIDGMSMRVTYSNDENTLGRAKMDRVIIKLHLTNGVSVDEITL